MLTLLDLLMTHDTVIHIVPLEILFCLQVFLLFVVLCLHSWWLLLTLWSKLNFCSFLNVSSCLEFHSQDSQALKAGIRKLLLEKARLVNILDFGGHNVSVLTTQSSSSTVAQMQPEIIHE